MSFVNSHNKQESKIPLDRVSATMWILLGIMSATWRCRISGSNQIHPLRDKNKGIIFCFWHSQILPIAYVFRGSEVKAVISSSRDGERIAAIAQRWGYGVIRGSSSRNSLSVLRNCVRAIGNKENIAITPDGPKGPREVVKPGIAHIGLITQAPIVTIAAKTKPFIRLHSWDRFMIPLPFSKVEIILGNPIYPHSFSDKEDGAIMLIAELQKKLTLLI